jgi:anti-sigma factor RsiW
MKTNCEKWNEAMLEAALSDHGNPQLDEHLRACPSCAQELLVFRAARQRMDALLPKLANEASPREQFSAQVLHATRASMPGKWRRISMLTAAPVLIALVLIFVLRQPSASSAELAKAEQLARWHAPTDALLETPGQDLLRTMPQFGETYLKPQALSAKEN